MHICRNSLHCTVLKNKIDLNEESGTKVSGSFCRGTFKSLGVVCGGKGLAIYVKIAIISCKNENFIVWLLRKMMNIQLDRGAGFISIF